MTKTLHNAWPEEPSAARRRAMIALLLLVPVPSLGVLAAMAWEPTRGTTLGQAMYFAAKVWIVALPVCWRIFIERKPVSLSRPRSGGLLPGFITGVVIAACTVGGYALIGRNLIDVAAMRDAAIANGIGQPAKYVPFVILLSLGNALLEEYVWRWFVFRQCERLIGSPVAIIITAALFTLHHVFALNAQTSWNVTLLASGGLFIGSCTWSWLYRRYRSIWPGYISHVLADVAVFGVGYHILFH